MRWTDTYSGKEYAISTSGCSGGSVVRVNTYGDVFDAFRNHPEPKSLGPDGEPCGPATIGKLSRRPVFGMYPIYMGKEANRLEEVEQATIHDWDEVRNEYHDPKADPWRRLVVPILQRINRSEVARLAGITERHVARLRNLQESPSQELRKLLITIAAEHSRKSIEPNKSMDDLAVCAVYLQTFSRSR